jgi:hypothetical protein
MKSGLAGAPDHGQSRLAILPQVATHDFYALCGELALFRIVPRVPNIRLALESQAVKGINDSVADHAHSEHQHQMLVSP